MRTHGMGLFAEMMDFDPPNDEVARARFDKDYFLKRLAVPGICGAASYEAIKGTPRFLHLYEADDVHAFYSEAFKEAVAPSEDEDEGIEKAKTAGVRLVCAQIYPALPINTPACPTVDLAGLAPVVQFGRIFVPPEKRADFNGWYAQERAPLVENVPGIRRIRRYAPVEGDEVMVVLYEMEDESVTQTAEWKEMMSTDWTARVRGYYRQAEGSPGVYRRCGIAY